MDTSGDLDELKRWKGNGRSTRFTEKSEILGKINR